MNGKALSIILPTYNERENAVSLIKCINEEIGKIDYEIVVVDDDSPDGTGVTLKRVFNDDPRIKIFVREGQRGLATAILYGIKNSSGQMILVMDTDFNHDPAVIPRMFRLAQEYDMVIGSRFVRGGGMDDKLRYLFSLLYNVFIGRVLVTGLRDNLCGYFIISREKLYHCDLDRIFYGYGDYFIRLIYFLKRQDISIIEIPVYYKRRQYGKSKSRFLEMFLEYTKTVLRLRFLNK